MNFDIKTVGAVIAAITALIGAAAAIGAFIYNTLIGYASHRRERYNFAKDFFEYMQQTKNIHPFVVEKGYQAVAGDTNLKTAEIEYLLSLKDADRSIKDYVLGKQFLEYLPHEKQSKITFVEKYKSRRARSWRTNLYFSLYFVLFVVAFLPTILSKIVHIQIDNLVPLSGLFVVFFLPFSYMALKAGSRIYRAGELVKSQHIRSEIPHIVRIVKATRKRA